MSTDRKTQKEVIDSLPLHLQPFVAYQYYSLYTARDHAVWRFLLHQLRENLTLTALPIYLHGLEKTGIGLDRIPRIEDINYCLNAVGWQAVVVDGFVPSAIFMEFQACRVLVIAVNMRSVEHMLYTPAPDIVHESAGHAPFLVDVDYAEFLQAVGELGMRAIACQGDFDVYEAVRNLSIIKESPDSSSADIELAGKSLRQALQRNDVPSEMALLSRLHWWTVEYGLVGRVDEYRIFGAGLLSSLGECISCLDDDNVKKISLTVDAIETAYDITCTQPQLFVTKNCRHLSQVLAEFGKQMCCNLGGLSSVKKAIVSACINTAELDCGIQISGLLVKVLSDAVGNVSYLQCQGPTQLCYLGQQLDGQGSDYHCEGYGTAIGRLQGMERCLSSYSIDELDRHGIIINHYVELVFLSGICVSGKLCKVLRRDQKNILFSFSACTVTTSKGECLFQPSWGMYDMAIGEQVSSVFGGAADPSRYSLYKVPSRKTTVTADYDERSRSLFEFYEQLRSWREALSCTEPELQEFLETLEEYEQQDPGQALEWLLYFEALEISVSEDFSQVFTRGLIRKVKQLMRLNADVEQLIRLGLQRLEIN